MTPFEEEEITVVEEKYPIKFSLGQFILLLGVEVVVLSLVFLLGARFGGGIFPNYPGETNQANRAFQGLAPPAEKPQADKLVDTPLEEIGTGNAEEEETVAADAEGEENEMDVLEKPVQANKSLFHNPGDKNTLIRFKSSGNTRFAIEVAEYFDEVLASREITKLKVKGYEAYLVIENASSSAPSYGVRVGSFGDRKLAESYAAKMSNEQGLELRVVQVD
jgi:hypothetical protein